MRFSSIAIILIFITACSTSSNQKDEQRIAKKVDAILNQMTLAEKVGQMTQIDLRMFDEYDDIKNYHIGSVLSGGAGSPKNNTPLSYFRNNRWLF